MHQPNTIPKRCARYAPHRPLGAAVFRAEDHMCGGTGMGPVGANDAVTKRMRAEVQETTVQVSEATDQTRAALRSQTVYSPDWAAQGSIQAILTRLVSSGSSRTANRPSAF